MRSIENVSHNHRSYNTPDDNQETQEPNFILPAKLSLKLTEKNCDLPRVPEKEDGEFDQPP
jgi:hypothetical protein